MTTHPAPITAGDTFGEWTVIDPAAARRPGGRHQPLALCRCSCGAEVLVLRDNVRSGRSRRCLACGLAARRVGADLVPDPAVREKWLNARRNMIARCENLRLANYRNYGGRGIRVCATWRADPRAFLKWVAAHPRHADRSMTLERLDPDEDYGPVNCRLATRAEQARNRRTCRRVVYRNRTMIAAEFRREHAWALSEAMVHRHLRNGKSPAWVVWRHNLRLARPGGTADRVGGTGPPAGDLGLWGRDGCGPVGLEGTPAHIPVTPAAGR